MSLPRLPVSESVVEAAINSARNAMLPIAVEDAKWLNEIGRFRSAGLLTSDFESVNRLTRFLDNHSVLYFTNGAEWYDIHPLIRDEVEAPIGAGAAAIPV